MLNESAQQFVQILLLALIGAVVPTIAAEVALYLKHALELLRVKLGVEKSAMLDAIVTTVVLAAEQSDLKLNLFTSATEKKNWAVLEAQRILTEGGWGKINVATLSTLIEAKLREGVHKVYPPVAVEPPPEPISAIGSL